MDKIGFNRSRNSVENYIKWRKEKIESALLRVKKLADLRNKKVLDVGCGFGPLSEMLLDEGADVSATEIDDDKLRFASEYFKDRKNFKLFKVNDETLPFKNSQFDTVFLFDVIEHTRDPGKMLKEAKRVLKNNGLLYVVFGPYYSITGHHLYDYAKWPIHILPKKYIKKIVYSAKKKGYFNNDYFWKQFLSLNKLRISRFQSLTRDLKLKKVSERFIVKYPEIFEINLPFLNYLGHFKDTLTMSFEGIYFNQKD